MAAGLPPPAPPGAGKCWPGHAHSRAPVDWDCPGYHRGFNSSQCEAVGCCTDASLYPARESGWCYPPYNASAHRSEPNASFIYYTHPWMVQEFFEGSAGCGRPASARNQTDVAAVEFAIRAGLIAWHAKPFTMIHELCDPEIFEWSLNISRELSARFGVSHGRSAGKATDIPGVSIGIVPLLAKAGIKALHLGTNGMGDQVFPVNITGHLGVTASCGAGKYNSRGDGCFDQVFRWQHPDTGHEIVMMMEQHYGTRIVVPKSTGFDQALRFQITGDNQKPPEPAAVREFWGQVRTEFPNAVLKASTLDNFADALWEVRDTLPVVTQEIGNAWLPQMGTDPWRFRALRAVSRLRSEWLAAGRLAWDDPDLHDYTSGLLVPVEHNFGMATKKVLDAKIHDHFWTNSQFWPLINRPDGNLSGFPGLQFYSDERDRYIHPRPTKSTASNGFKAFAALVNRTLKELTVVPAIGTMLASGNLTPVDVTDPKALTLNGSGLSLTFDPETGGISSLVEKAGGREWVAAGQRLGEFVYRTYTQKHDINPYMRQFVPGHPINETDMKTFPWSKPGMDLSIESDPAMPPLANCSRAWPVRLLKAWRGERTMLLQLALPAAAVALFGGMGEIALKVTLPAATRATGGSSAVELTLTWKNKTATRLAESSWLSFVPAVPQPEKGWRLDVLGSPVDPLSVGYNGSRHLHAVHRGVCYDDSAVRLAIESIDVPLVAPGDAAHLIDFDNRLPDLEGGFHFNLHNNAGWDQSAPQWYGKDASFGFELKLNAPKGCWDSVAKHTKQTL